MAPYGSESSKLKGEIKLLLKIAKHVPDSVSLAAFRDMISKMTPDVLLHQDRRGNFLHKCAYDGDSIGLRAFLAVGPKDFRETKRRISGWTPLFDAVKQGNVECTRALLEDSRPQYREMKNQFGYTALHIAALCGHPSCVKLLLDDASPGLSSIKNKDGNTALHMAASYKRLSCVRILLNECPGLYKIKNEMGDCAIEFTNKLEIIEEFLRFKYIDIILAKMIETVVILDDKDTFWCDDSVVKDTLIWTIGNEYLDLNNAMMSPSPHNDFRHLNDFIT
eukprot:TRINITY_DN773076_c0_g1_i1.p1 TRINITY_DN773076_c0_g1~~TRINITY_DN773076_c0_g1_i1.p1  ORF type:complete len:278 (-),score=35.25 TRINITY_DN773076_c0_g1_i1:253-1086(-)